MRQLFSCILFIVYTAYRVYCQSCILFIAYTVRHVYGLSCILSIMYTVYQDLPGDVRQELCVQSRP